MVIQKCVSNKDIIFCWVPSHVVIKGNKKADTAAKSCLDLRHVKVGVLYTAFKYISKIIGMWNSAIANKLQSVKPVLRDWRSSYR